MYNVGYRGLRARASRSADGATALHLASQNDHVEVVRLLLACQGVEVTKSTQNGFTALMLASQNGHVEVVRLPLARKGVEINENAADGATAPHTLSPFP